MIDIRKLKELVRLMVENELTELDLNDKDEKVSIKRGGTPIIAHPPMAYAPSAVASGVRAASGDDDAESASPASAGRDPDLVAVESPMVGTYYSAPNPDSEPFVKVGSSVSEGTTVCLVEAMKVFNEIKAEVSGVVERICVNTGDSVEFGQELILVRPG